jgi:hypothetical protein
MKTVLWSQTCTGIGVPPRPVKAIRGPLYDPPGLCFNRCADVAKPLIRGLHRRGECRRDMRAMIDSRRRCKGVAVSLVVQDMPLPTPGLSL